MSNKSFAPSKKGFERFCILFAFENHTPKRWLSGKKIVELKKRESPQSYTVSDHNNMMTEFSNSEPHILQNSSQMNGNVFYTADTITLFPSLPNKQFHIETNCHSNQIY